MNPNLDKSRLELWLSERIGQAVEVRELRHLTGGASQDSWSLDLCCKDESQPVQPLVLRRDMGGKIQDEGLTREQEYHVLAAAHASGVNAPRPRWLCTDPRVLGADFFVMDRIEGESVGSRIVRQPALEAARKVLPVQMAEQIALIHELADAKTLAFLPRPESGESPAAAVLKRAEQQLRRYQEPHPVLEWALRWLIGNAPDCSEPVFCHGDFRVGNLMVGPEGLRSVLDWEFAHIGDPAEDLAWPCVRSWRFGQDHFYLGGIGQPEEFWQAYERIRNTTIDRKRLRFWEVVGNFRWAIGCLAQAHRHLSGEALSLELASLGRRKAEMESELLRLIETEVETKS